MRGTRLGHELGQFERDIIRLGFLVGDRERLRDGFSGRAFEDGLEARATGSRRCGPGRRGYCGGAFLGLQDGAEHPVGELGVGVQQFRVVSEVQLHQLLRQDRDAAERRARLCGGRFARQDLFRDATQPFSVALPQP